MRRIPATRANVARLRDDFGYTIVEPETGPLASGQIRRRAGWPSCRGSSTPSSRPSRDAPDPGRRTRAARPPVVEPPREPDLEGRHVVVSAGGTAEPIDPVRFIGNRSTGKMGVALAEAALDRGARVTLVVGTRHRAAAGRRAGRPRRDDRRDAGRGARRSSTAADALIMAAAVADFRPRARGDDEARAATRA